MNPQPINADDYRTFMQSAAFAYLERHRAQYLTGDDQLFTACVQHLVNALDVPVFLSQQLCQLAWNDHFCAPRFDVVDRDMGLGGVATRLSTLRRIIERPEHP